LKVTLLETGKTADFNDSYGARLLEQGKAVRVKEEPIMAEPIVDEEPEEEQTPTGGTKQKKSRKGE